MRYKGIGFDCKDHPDGLAGLLIANNCTYGCKNCINEHLKCEKSRSTNPFAQVDYVLANTPSKCIVLGGLEWTEQIYDLIEVLDACEELGANVILYTHWTEQEFKENFPRLLEYDMWIKYGAYIEELKSNDYYSHGIPLASTNQYIKRNVVDKKS